MITPIEIKCIRARCREPGDYKFDNKDVLDLVDEIERLQLERDKLNKEKTWFYEMYKFAVNKGTELEDEVAKLTAKQNETLKLYTEALHQVIANWKW